MYQKIFKTLVFALGIYFQLESYLMAQTDLYFAYGSNINSEFLSERLKNGDWTRDGWYKSGNLQGPSPEDLGTYVLDDYEFGYNIADTDSQSGPDQETAGNITAKKGSHVYGVLYRITQAQLHELDESEDAPENYIRTAVTVHRVAVSQLKPKEDTPTSVTAWAYVGNPKYLTTQINPDPKYVELLCNSAKKREFPEDYITQFLDLPLQVAQSEKNLL